MSSNDTDDREASVPSTMAKRRLKSLRRLINDSSAVPLSRRPLSPNSQRQLLEERIRNLQRNKDGNNDSEMAMAGPAISTGSPGLLDQADATARGNDEGIPQPAQVQLLQQNRVSVDVASTGIYAMQEAHRIVMERKAPSEQSVRSFASEENANFVNSDHGTNSLPDSDTGNNSNTNRQTNNFTTSYQGYHDGSNGLRQPLGQKEQQTNDAGTAVDALDDSTQAPAQNIEARRTPHAPPGGTQQLHNALNRKIALQQLVQRKLAQQRLMAQQQAHEERLAQLSGPVRFQEGPNVARDALVQQNIQQQQQLNSQRLVMVAQQLQQERAHRQNLAAQAPVNQNRPSQHQQQYGSRLTHQQQQMLLLQREQKLRRELSARDAMRSHIPLRHEPVGEHIYAPQRGPGASTSGGMSFRGLGRDALSPYHDYSSHHVPMPPDAYQDMGPPPVPQLADYQQTQYYEEDEPIYEDVLLNRMPVYTSSRMASTRSLSTMGSIHRVHTPPSPPPPTEKMVEVSPDFWVRLRGADETWAAIEHDFYSPVICFGCGLELCCIQDADFVLCPTCRVVSPMNGIGEQVQNGKDGGVGLGFTYDNLAQWQAEILAKRQRPRNDRGLYAS